MSLLHRALPGWALLAPLAAAQATGMPDAPPTQLVCQPDAIHSVRLSRDAAGLPLQVSLSVSAGARECDWASTGPAVEQADGSWRFDWTDTTLNQRQRVEVRRAGADGYTLAFTPAACGALQILATAMLAPTAAGCAVSVDRGGAFVQFWRQLRDALARGDGELLQRLSLPQLEFVEGPDIVKAPSTVMRRAARCLPDVTATTQRLDIRSMIAGDTPPRLDMPPLSRKGDGRIDFAGAMSLRWTPQGWRMEGFNASRDVFAKCPVG